MIKKKRTLFWTLKKAKKANFVMTCPILIFFQLKIPQTIPTAAL